MLKCLTASLMMSAASVLAAAYPTFEEARPLLEKYCYECHSADKRKGGVDLQRFDTEDKYREEPFMVEDVKHVIHEEDMPPSKAPQPTAEERAKMEAWAKGLLKAMESAAPNDPGVVIVPRINSQEYDYVVRDLTGKPLRMGQYLTADSSAGEGFLNVGAAQPMQVGNFESFLAVGKKLLEHARVAPGLGLVWFEAPQPPGYTNEDLAKSMRVAYQDWFDKYQAEVLAGQLADLKKAGLELSTAYMEAAWQYEHRAALGMANAGFTEIADAYPVPLFPGAVEKMWRLMKKDETVKVHKPLLANPLMVQLIEQFTALPAPKGRAKDTARAEIKAISAWLLERITWDPNFGHKYDPLEMPLDRPEAQALRGGKVPKGFYPFQIDLTKASGGAVYICISTQFDGPDGDIVLVTDGRLEFKGGQSKPLHQAISGFTDAKGAKIAFGTHPKGSAPADTVGAGSGGYLKMDIPEGAEKLFVTVKVDEEHAPNTTVQPWITDKPPASFEGFRARWTLGSKDKVVKNAIKGMDVWLNTQSGGYLKPRPEIIYANLNAEARAFLGVKEAPPQEPWVREPLLSLNATDLQHRATPEMKAELDGIVKLVGVIGSAGAKPLAELRGEASGIIQDFASKAWRRPVTAEEMNKLLGLYDYEAGKGASFDAAVKTPLTAVLASPVFLYRFTASKGSPDPYPIGDKELATKLAFTFWASIPDEELTARAAEGKLQDEAVLKAQVRRLLADPKARGFIEQFTGHWLQFSAFDMFDGPDAMKFKEFDAALKTAMYDEVVYFLKDIIQNNKPITLALDADYTFLNERLARHYGIEGVTGPEMRIVKIPADQRGGLLGMGAFLTKFSAPLRTSPVKRGVWAYEQVLGIKLAEPPPNVPQLSDEEKNEAGLTVAQQLAEHRSNPACFDCHDKFDPIGVALENFDPIGRWRTAIEGTPVDSLGKFGSGQELKGFADLKSYMAGRKDQFASAFNRKLLAYALGRALLPTDKPLLDQMDAALKAANYAPAASIDLLVTSRQFRYRRDDLPETQTASSQPLNPPTQAMP